VNRVLGKKALKQELIFKKMIKHADQFCGFCYCMRIEENVQTVKVRKDTKQYGRRII
jgi:hypothetical protein